MVEPIALFHSLFDIVTASFIVLFGTSKNLWVVRVAMSTDWSLSSTHPVPTLKCSPEVSTVWVWTR